MSRFINLACAQMGPIARTDSRAVVVKRQIALLREAKSRGADFVVFPELAFTTFFPRWLLSDQAEIDSFFERDMPGPETQPLFDAAKDLGIGFYIGYAELAEEEGQTRRFNTAIIVDTMGEIVGKYRKIHLPGHAEPVEGRASQHLEKRYFEPGDLGFPVWRTLDGIIGMCICNDRRWPETYRVMALQGAELVCVGYNTPDDHTGVFDFDQLTGFHHQLSLQAGAYQNATWVAAAAKGGCEEGSNMIGLSMIVAPSGQIVAMASSTGDELISARCDLDMGTLYKRTIFDFARHREPSHYGLIVERKGAVVEV
ncbi:N-carbamoyl-D-amino-acid hydrolase [Agrobacterium vitis]|uniref:N-carbamoyl-D-amino-acid hydrolase n=1 Tax=Rhizobium/Agrobacterium group TaxID=227290 RepID=UPI0008DBF5CE|nr:MULTISPECIES: N-carbamoyl-D-amino-acid hydrolase [Rhizobium/Agrobacterium group]MCF1436620.1 N-carbamoyl-D-amino-acid hydrolase [Allorhizobium ampelinum]MUO91859.1 N-carbamoyl-D-amino-acid hydrolase [Agrobacterium vitis]MUZ55303.1 N-carbamoyl-D-amino-acid hydrolase [Agrobacterium vitis]MUZ94528.1 N-carbamoyl-D-amino-acid hydrolase [Agrobacterium vitis]MVA42847.1 N-carbamoyl-D-amino-acid hydrolase [Agrobacterium vitis]